MAKASLSSRVETAEMDFIIDYRGSCETMNISV